MKTALKVLSIISIVASILAIVGLMTEGSEPMAYLFGLTWLAHGIVGLVYISQVDKK